jgi:hypothetical protein
MDMNRALSRPTLWARELDRASDALHSLQYLREEWLEKLEELESEWTSCRERFNHAIGQLIGLQDDYATWSVPENLYNSRTQEKLDDVRSIDFRALQGIIPDVKKTVDALEKFDFDEARLSLGDARLVILPKGYGRD